MHMAMAWIWTGMAAVSLIFAAWNGTMDAVGAAALEGAGAAVQLCIAMAGVLCLWSGVMEIMSRCGLSEKLAALLRPALRRLLPRASRDPETLAAVSANVSANLLVWAMRPRPWASERPGAWPGEPTAPPMTSCAAWWC